jgi:hypothetical protein
MCTTQINDERRAERGEQGASERGGQREPMAQREDGRERKAGGIRERGGKKEEKPTSSHR